MYYRNAQAAFIVCDCSRKETLADTVKWKSQVSEKVLLSNGEALPVILLVNKCDIPDNGMTDEEIDAVCKQCGIQQWFRVCIVTVFNTVDVCEEWRKYSSKHGEDAG